MNGRKKTSRERMLKRPLLCQFHGPQVVALRRPNADSGKPGQHVVPMGADMAIAKHKGQP